jgi:D-alanyl-D-alanine dipeptidase
MRILILLIPILIFSSCSRGPEKVKDAEQPVNKEDTVVSKSISEQESLPDPEVNDSVLRVHDLVDVQKLNARIFIDLKYAGSDNFLGMRLYERIRKAYLQKDVAERLSRCQDYLTDLDTGMHLLIYDAVRPVSVQRKMWRALDSIPPKRRGDYVSNPANRSLHNYGAAVDLTICDSKGVPIDMGAGFDEFNEIAYPSMEATFLANGQLTKEQVENRKLLRKVMRSQAFRNLPTEWWHFNACSREDAGAKYSCLENEP